MFQVIFILSDWLLIKQIIISSTPFCYWRKDVSLGKMLKKCCLGEWVIYLCLECDDKNLGESFDWGGGMSKNAYFDAFSRKVNTIKLKVFAKNGGIYKFERKFKKHSRERERDKPKEFVEIWKDVFLWLINTVYHFVDSNLGVEISSKKRGKQKKGTLK